MQEPQVTEVGQDAAQATAETVSSGLFSEADIRGTIPESLHLLADTLADYPLLMVIVFVGIGYLLGKILQVVQTRYRQARK